MIFQLYVDQSDEYFYEILSTFSKRSCLDCRNWSNFFIYISGFLLVIIVVVFSMLVHILTHIIVIIAIYLITLLINKIFKPYYSLEKGMIATFSCRNFIIQESEIENACAVYVKWRI